MSEKNVKAARKVARINGVYTGKPAKVKGKQLWLQWPNRKARRK